MEPGRFRHRITIQNFKTEEMPSGQEKEIWFDVATNIPAEVKGISGRELMASGAEMAEASIRIWLRYRTDISSASRILWSPKGQPQMAYGLAATPIANDKFTRLELLCKGGVKP